MKKWGSLVLQAALLLFVGHATTNPAVAGIFQIAPVNIELAPGQSTTAVEIRNNDSEPVSIRVITFRWTQEGGKDIYTPSNDLIVSPPIFTMKGNTTQLIRFGTRKKEAGASYRVIFEEIPGPRTNPTGVQVTLRLNLPFYMLHEKGEPRLRWTASRGNDGVIVLTGHNDGTRHLQILEITAPDASGKKITASKEMGVVLPKASRHWILSPGAAIPDGAASIPISVRSAAGEISTDAIVETR